MINNAKNKVVNLCSKINVNDYFKGKMKIVNPSESFRSYNQNNL
jgi:hypothetical protein